MTPVRKTFALSYAEEPGRILRGVLTLPAEARGPRPAVLVVHGFKGFLRWGFFPELQDRIAARGWASVAVNLSGSGVGEDLESFTEDEAFFHATPSRALEDLERLRAFVEEEDAGIDFERLAIFGHSMGGGTALLHAARRGDYRAVVTWAAVARQVRFPEPVLDAWRRDGVVEIPNARTGQVHRLGMDWLEDVEQHAAELDIPAACGRLRCPTLLVHGTADEAVPFEEGEQLAAAIPFDVGRLLRVEGAGHTFGAVHPYRGSTPELEQAFTATLDHLAQALD